MAEENKKRSESSVVDLRGRQSVRATFKLSERSIEALSLVAFHLGIKQKSLFDHLIEDANALKDIAEKIRVRQFKKTIRIQKTYVLSRRTLEALDGMAKDHDTPRDALVEYSIRRLEAIIEAEKSKHELRKTLYKELAAHIESGKRLLEKSRALLGDDDPFCRSIEGGVLSCIKAGKDLESFIEKSKVIEEY